MNINIPHHLKYKITEINFSWHTHIERNVIGIRITLIFIMSQSKLLEYSLFSSNEILLLI